MLANEGNNYNKSSVINDNNKDNTKINDTNFSEFSSFTLLTCLIFYFKDSLTTLRKIKCIEKNKNEK